MAKKRLYYRIEYTNCDSIDYDYTIVADMSEARDYLDAVESCGDLQKADASIMITGIRMTEKQYCDWLTKYVEAA